MANIACLTIDTDDQYESVEQLIRDNHNESFAFVEGVTYVLQSQGGQPIKVCVSQVRPFKGGFILGSTPVMYTHRSGSSLYVKSICLRGELNIAE